MFRTMGLRHVVIVDGDLLVKGIVTRSDLDEHRLEHFWHEQVRKTLKRNLFFIILFLIVFLSFSINQLTNRVKQCRKK
jgi:hypothetical protein